MDIIEFHDEETGGLIYFQAPTNSGWRDISSSGEEKKKLSGKLKDTLNSISTFGKGVIDTVKDLKPDEIEVKVGLTLDISEGELIGLLAKVGAESSFEVTLKWNNKETNKVA